MNIKWNEVTWYSKLGAILLFLLVVPVLTFIIGEKYQEVKDIQNTQFLFDSEIKESKSFSPIDVSVNKESFEISTSTSLFTVSKPVVSMPTSKSIQDKINTRIQEKINEIIVGESSAFGASTTVSITSDYYLVQRFNTLSVEFHDYANNERMTHPNFGNEAPLIFELTTGNERNIYGVLGLSQQDYLAQVSALTRKKLKSSYVSGTFFDDNQFQKGTDPKIENYQFSVLTEDGVKIYLAYDQIGMKPIEEPIVFITYQEFSL